MDKTVGMVGLGILGSTIAGHLLECGWSVLGCDPDQEAQNRHRSKGGNIVATPAEAAEPGICLLCLPNGDVVAEVCLSDNGIVDRTSDADLVVVDTTTSAPDRSIQTAEGLRRRGVDFVDASLSGSGRMARNKDLIALIGGRANSVARVSPVIEDFTRRSYHLGPIGSGARAKLVVNLVLGVHRLALAEGLLLGEKAGIDVGQLLDVLQDSAASSKAMTVWGERMILGDYWQDPGSRMRTHAKDMLLILELGDDLGVPLPLASVVYEVTGIAQRLGLDEADSGAVMLDVLRLHLEGSDH